MSDSWGEYLEAFDECPTCGAMLIDGENCPICEEDERRAEPRKPITLKKLDPKRQKKTQKRRMYGH